MPIWFFLLTQVSIIAYALLGGVFLAFSDFIMRSLARTSGAGGAEAMQIINREVFRWIFMVLFLGMAPVSLLIALFGGFSIGQASGTLMAAAGLVYLVGCFGVTIFFNVPMNEALAGMEVSVESTQGYWTETYLPKWTFWNSVRTAACITSAALLLIAQLWAARVPMI